MKHLTRKNAIRFLLVAIVFVLTKMIWDVYSCQETGGKWNPSKKVCELIIKDKIEN